MGAGWGSPRFDVIHGHQCKEGSCQSSPCAHRGLPGCEAGGGKEWARHRAQVGAARGVSVPLRHRGPEASAPIFSPFLRVIQASLKVTSSEWPPWPVTSSSSLALSVVASSWHLPTSERSFFIDCFLVPPVEHKLLEGLWPAHCCVPVPSTVLGPK